MANPKLEFYRFKLKHKSEDFKTFRDFAIDELQVGNKSQNETVVKALFKHFITSLDGDNSKDDKLKKQIVIIKKKSVNKYLDKQPAFDSNSNTIFGVINGGPYGRDRILSDIQDQEDSSVLGQNKAVLLYFYFLLYLPIDHNEGCFIIHSNGIDESITGLFRNFISNIFKGSSYFKVQCESFCPKSFQDEFKKGATLKSMWFKKTFVENTHNTEGLSNLMQQYDIKIEAIPKNKNIAITEAAKVRNFLSKKIFGNDKSPKSLKDFDETKIITENPVTDSTKTFEWNTKDSDFVPVVYLKGRIGKNNPDGTPDFEELAVLCKNYFNDEILPELRPDLYVSRAN
ncbi:MAG: hypothetical protein JXL97_19205 [Bacteroidales bacterium]|nr:hypothetical protein [Bacteroidales bacterium]